MFKKLMLNTALSLSILISATQLTTLAQVRLVMVNLKSHVYHTTKCKIGQKGKKNCLKTTQQRAIIIYKARPCKICFKHTKK